MHTKKKKERHGTFVWDNQCPVISTFGVCVDTSWYQPLFVAKMPQMWAQGCCSMIYNGTSLNDFGSKMMLLKPVWSMTKTSCRSVALGVIKR